MNYFELMQVQMGIPMWLLVTILIWSTIWKLIGMWKAAKKSHIAWFIIFAILNTVGILEILYIYIFSDMKKVSKKKVTKKTPKKKTKKVKKK